jgi:hypothetical protein
VDLWHVLEERISAEKGRQKARMSQQSESVEWPANADILDHLALGAIPLFAETFLLQISFRGYKYFRRMMTLTATQSGSIATREGAQLLRSVNIRLDFGFLACSDSHVGLHQLAHCSTASLFSHILLVINVIIIMQIVGPCCSLFSRQASEWLSSAPLWSFITVTSSPFASMIIHPTLTRLLVP